MFRWNRLSRYAPDDGGNSGGEGGAAQGGGDPIARGIERLLERNGNDANAALLVLYRDNYDLREANRQLKTKVPAEGAVVLSAEQAQAWTAYQQLGQPADLQTALSERDQARGDLAKLQRSAAIREAAEVAGYKASVLAGLDTQAGGLAYEVREVTDANGAKSRVAYVKAAEGDPVPLTQFAETQWGDFLPALATTPPPAQGTPYPAQQQGSRPLAKDLVAQFQQEQDEVRKAVKNPLLKE